MPSKIQLDENLWFLFVCLQKSDYKAIDFNAVGEITKLKPPAARMRYTRLRRAIEGGTLIGTHGTPFQGGADKIWEAQKKRKRTSRSGRGKVEDDLEPIRRRNGSLIKTKPKGEKVDNRREYGREGESDEDVVPSAKRRSKVLGKRRISIEEDVDFETTDLMASAPDKMHCRTGIGATLDTTVLSDIEFRHRK
ncbi:MAG: hypothetical protein M1827_002265 [Pycnora praestabilis]|nr:MAG: hypothetical protein M1827_002265 [Pycnora praestabilis]